MSRSLGLIAITALVVTACATGGETASTTEAAEPVTTLPASPDTSDTTASTLDDGRATTTTTAPEGATTVSNRPLAPDFTLELGEGGTYTLSEGSKPVYLVFWAEW